jgi:thiamine biosynthesis lipoprotein
MERLEFKAMGCSMMAVLDAEGLVARRELARVPDWFEAWERSLSRFRPGSELARLNNRAAQGQSRPFKVSVVLWSALRASLHAARYTTGLVTPTLLDALVAAGYDRTFEELPAATGRSGLSIAAQPVLGIAGSEWREIRCEARTHTVRLPPEVHLDLGGTAKGWAAQRAARRLAARTGAPALVDAGGDIAASGPMQGGSPWPVAVADPHETERDIEVLNLGAGMHGIATSGRDYRRWQRGSTHQHHIIDPRTGRPALTDVLSVTVIAPTLLEAEAAAKVVLIMGSGAGMTWLESQHELAGLLVLDGGEVLRSNRLNDYVWS